MAEPALYFSDLSTFSRPEIISLRVGMCEWTWCVGSGIVCRDCSAAVCFGEFEISRELLK